MEMEVYGGYRNIDVQNYQIASNTNKDKEFSVFHISLRFCEM